MRKTTAILMSLFAATAAYLASTPTASASTLHVPESCVGGPCDDGVACFEATCLSLTIQCGPDPLGELVCYVLFTPLAVVCSAAPSTCALLFNAGACTGYQSCDREGPVCVQTAERYCPHQSVSACAGSLCPAGEEACASASGDVDADLCAGACDAPTLCATLGAVCDDLQCDGWFSTSLDPGACVGYGAYCDGILCYRLRAGDYPNCLILL